MGAPEITSYDHEDDQHDDADLAQHLSRYSSWIVQTWPTRAAKGSDRLVATCIVAT